MIKLLICISSLLAGFGLGCLYKDKNKDEGEKRNGCYINFDATSKEPRPFVTLTKEQFDDYLTRRESDEEFLSNLEHPEDDEPEEEFEEYKELTLPYSSTEDEHEDDPDEDDEDISWPSGKELITEEEYNKSNGYDKVELLYFPEVDAVCFENEDKLEDPVKWLGGSAAPLAKSNSCIRNHDLATDFMVTAKPGRPYWYEET